MSERPCPFPIIEAGADRDILSVPQERVKAAILESGGLLLRGFDVNVDAFSKFSKQFMTKPFVHGYTPVSRKELDNPEMREGFGSRVEVSADRTVTTVNVGKAHAVLHGDVSYYPMRPDLAFFSCVRPADSAGETTFADGTTIPDLMSAATRSLFEKNRAKFLRRSDAAAWCMMFGVNNTREELRAVFESWRLKAESRGEIFRVFFRDEAPHLFDPDGRDIDEPHPNDTYAEYITPILPKRRDGRRVFCSQLSVVARFDHRLHGSVEDPRVYDKVLSSRETYELFERKGNFNCVVFENGEVIPDEALDELDAVCAKIEYPHPWRPADVIAIDNWRSPHGRRAYTDLKREILTTFGYTDFVEQVIPQ